MKLKIFLGILVGAFCLAGCSKNDDGPQLSDDELLKKGQNGRSQAMGSQKAPAGAPAKGAPATGG